MDPQTPTFQPQQKGGSKFTTFLTVITIVFLVFVAYKNMDNITQLLGGGAVNTGTTSGLQIGQQVAIEGTLTANGDYINYTHQLETTSDGIFGLKSKTIDLNQYSGTVSIEGTVEKDLGPTQSGNSEMYIIDVINIIGNIALSGDMVGEIVPNGMYIEKAGLYLPEDFFANYALLNSGESNVVKVQKIGGTQTINIQYFTCKTSNQNENCTTLSKNFSSSNEKTLTTSNNDTFFKLEGTDSWFFTNNLYGYFINNIPAQDVEALSQYLILPNTDYVKENVMPKVSSICIDGNIVLAQADKSSLALENNRIVAKFTGKVNSGGAECKVAINPSLPNLGEKVAFYYPEAGSVTTTTPTTTTNGGTSLTTPSGVKQFPINLEKALTFTSSRGGYSIIFPSSNISYDSSNTQTDLDTAGINCSTQFNVIKYSDKANLDITPAVKIYECRVKNTVNIPSIYAQKTLEDGRVFLIEAVDPARVDFVNNIVIQ
ncbi:MAG: hypothetical protein CO170_00180 [candidate division SR1 bacterium CG_4_9_14_3_um_filter_40_9]|nr:MAG: hypothetical protein CO170_00180 [candidate division SR1 bacterium CG_4_9_14_3_um_filter_40_9]